MTRTETSENPFFAAWTTPDGVPPFDSHQARAFPAGLRACARRARDRDFRDRRRSAAAELRQYDRGDGDERTGAHVASATSSTCWSARTATMRCLRSSAKSPRELPATGTKSTPTQPLFRRIDTLAKKAETLDLTAEQKRVLERYHITFRRAGAGLDGTAKKRLAEIIERLAALGHRVQPERARRRAGFCADAS